MKSAIRTAATLLLLAGAAGCNNIGDGNTIERFQIAVSPVGSLEQGIFVDFGEPTERYHMYDCFCSNIVALATFGDGTLANFNSRVTYTTDNPGVLAVLNSGDTADPDCPIQQQTPGLLIPKGIGTATITTSFAGLSDTLVVDVTDSLQNVDGSPAVYTLRPSPPARATDTDVAVGTALTLQLIGTLDGRTRDLSDNVMTWSFDNVDDTLATITTNGIVRGVSPTGAAPRVARVAFGSCTSLSPTLAINVGDVLQPLTLAREAPDFALDGMLALDSDEKLVSTASLDFDGDGNADGSQEVSQLIGLTYTDSCTLREYDVTVPTTSCRETATTCASTTVQQCASATATSCPLGMAPCRVDASPIQGGVGTNQIQGVLDNGAPSNFTAILPGTQGVATTLATAVPDAVATELTVTTLALYPTTFPWFGTIDKNGAREDVRVTAATGTTLTVDRGIGGTTAAAHAGGVSFEQRSYSSDPNTPLPIRAKEGTLTTVVIEPPGTLDAGSFLQFSARGTFVDQASASRQQRVTRLSSLGPGSPRVVWRSSDALVAIVTQNGGLVTSRSTCGGRFSLRARASTSTDTTTELFDPATTADDDACKNTDPLCDQIEYCIPSPSPLPIGADCPTPTTCP